MRTVHELNQNELEELRSRWFHQHLDDGSLHEVLDKETTEEEEVPMDVVKSYYEDTYFVEEDFWCNVNYNTMQLEKQHRQALLSSLEDAKKDLDIHVKMLSRKENENIAPNIEISMFLAQQRIKLIEESLINNEIDF